MIEPKTTPIAAASVSDIVKHWDTYKKRIESIKVILAENGVNYYCFLDGIQLLDENKLTITSKPFNVTHHDTFSTKLMSIIDSYSMYREQFILTVWRIKSFRKLGESMLIYECNFNGTLEVKCPK